MQTTGQYLSIMFANAQTYLPAWRVTVHKKAVRVSQQRPWHSGRGCGSQGTRYSDTCKFLDGRW
jgi:hypothetical protein